MHACASPATRQRRIPTLDQHMLKARSLPRRKASGQRTPRAHTARAAPLETHECESARRCRGRPAAHRATAIFSGAIKNAPARRCLIKFAAGVRSSKGNTVNQSHLTAPLHHSGTLRPGNKPQCRTTREGEVSKRGPTGVKCGWTREKPRRSRKKCRPLLNGPDAVFTRSGKTVSSICLVEKRPPPHGDGRKKRRALLDDKKNRYCSRTFAAAAQERETSQSASPSSG